METLCSVLEVNTYLTFFKNSNKPTWVSLSLEDKSLIDSEVSRLRSGELLIDALTALEQYSVDAILFNCSQPEVMANTISMTQSYLQNHKKLTKIGVYANAFQVNQKSYATANDHLHVIREDLTPDAYFDYALQWQRLGVDIIGGCCGVGSKHIKKLSELSV